MTKILNKGDSLQGECREGILWSKDDVFTQVMGAERCGRVCGSVLDQPHQEEVGPTFHVIH